MLDVMDEKESLLAEAVAFESRRTEDAPVIRKLRQAGAERFAALGFPTVRDEEWRFTPLTALTRQTFSLAQGQTLTHAELATVALEIPGAIPLVFVNGQFAPTLSPRGALPNGVSLGSLANMLGNPSAGETLQIGRYLDFEDLPFVALNTAFLHDGAFLHVTRGKTLEAPIHLIFLSTARELPGMSHPRILIRMEAGSQATLIESYLNLGEGITWTNAVTEFHLEEGAIVDHYKVQRENLSSFHTATTQIHQSRASTFRSHAITLGAKLARNDIHALLSQEGCECTLNGLYKAGGEQLIDNHTRIDHAAPHCQSHELYKGVLEGKSHGVFNGKIYVHQDAQKTDAKQTNQTLLLSQDAVIDTKPQLEIFADDVKCTHGATVGQLDPTMLFYLRSRGIGQSEARALLTFAFANDIIERIKVEPLRRDLELTLLAAQGLPLTDASEEEV